ncbi:MAG: hypothetical protein IJ398_03355 [Clostridia bacterium]|nr:hypothetical protein [Clostridia bacterium]
MNKNRKLKSNICLALALIFILSVFFLIFNTEHCCTCCENTICATCEAFKGIERNTIFPVPSLNSFGAQIIIIFLATLCIFCLETTLSLIKLHVKLSN